LLKILFITKEPTKNKKYFNLTWPQDHSTRKKTNKNNKDTAEKLNIISIEISRKYFEAQKSLKLNIPITLNAIKYNKNEKSI